MGRTRDFLGKGFGFPPKIDSATGKFVMTEGEEDIRQAVYLILMTRTKERAMLPDFGCDLHNYIYELPDSAFESQICNEIEEALAQWEPRIRDTKVTLDASDRMNGVVYLNVEYVIRATNNPNNLVFPYYLEEGAGEL